MSFTEVAKLRAGDDLYKINTFVNSSFVASGYSYSHPSVLQKYTGEEWKEIDEWDSKFGSTRYSSTERQIGKAKKQIALLDGHDESEVEVVEEEYSLIS